MKHSDKQFMLICARSRQGFFTNYLHILQYLNDAEQERRIPIIHWEGGVYIAKKNKYNGIRSKNIWDYFFEPVSNFALSDLVDKYELSQWGPVKISVPNIKIVFDYRHISKEHEPPFCWSTKLYPPDICLNNPTAEGRRYIGGIIQKYVRIKQTVQDKIDAFYDTFMRDKKVLGIHIRGTKELERDQGKNFFQRYVKYTDEYLSQNPGAMIFLATDHVNYEREMRERYKDLILCRETVKSNNEHAVQYGCKAKKRFSPGGARVAEEVIIDVMLLARCQMLIRGFSNVASVASFVSPEMPCKNVCEYDADDREFLGINSKEYKQILANGR